MVNFGVHIDDLQTLLKVVQVVVNGEGWAEVNKLATAAQTMWTRVEHSRGARMIQRSKQFDFWSLKRIVFGNSNFEAEHTTLVRRITRSNHISIEH